MALVLVLLFVLVFVFVSNMKVEQGCHLMSPIMTLTKAYSMREKKTKRVQEDMNISIACRKTGFIIQLIATKI